MESEEQKITSDTQSADGSWGWLHIFEKYGTPGDTASDFKLISYDDAMTTYADNMHAGHAMYFSRTDKVVWELYKVRAYVMMQMRFDGMLGFPGGLIEKGEDPVTGVNRELVEEIGIDPDQDSVELADLVTTHLHEKKKLILHFFVKEISQNDFKRIEERALKAEEYGIEMLGTVRPPLFTMGDNYRGFPAFLSNIFCGNAKEQLLCGIAKHNILTKEEIEKAVKDSQANKKVT